jgi:hypothetical protein
MERIHSFSNSESKILTDVRRCLESVWQAACKDVTSAIDGINVLSKLRQVAYEDINQIQHEEMVLRAARSLQESDFPHQQIEWYWNPRQTGDNSEPDLRATIGKDVLLSAEVTTSEKPVGKIDTRIRDTLTKLNSMPGRKFYFVRTISMEQRARTKVKKADFAIEVRKI